MSVKKYVSVSCQLKTGCREFLNKITFKKKDARERKHVGSFLYKLQNDNENLKFYTSFSKLAPIEEYRGYLKIQ